MKSHVLLKDVEKSYNGHPVLSQLNLSIEQGEFVAVVGKSGCGKSTLLRLIAGLEPFQEGTISLFGKPLTNLNEQARIMFQDERLLPWKRILDNVSLGLPRELKDKALESLDQVGLKHRKDAYISELSGGQRQRVALARALVHDPSLLLLDEPLGALDALTRMEMQELIESLWFRKKFTAVLVTHDVEEAIRIANRVILIDKGRISLDIRIQLPRPRQRTHPLFAAYTDEILCKILGKTSEQAAPSSKELITFYTVKNESHTEKNTH